MSVTVTRPSKCSVKATCALCEETDFIEISSPSAKHECVWVNLTIVTGGAEESIGLFLSHSDARDFALELGRMVNGLDEEES